MSNTDIVREVDEELRREQYEKLWQQYKWWILSAAALIIAIVAGYKGYQGWQAQRAAAAGTQFNAALTLLRDGKKDEAAKALQSIVDTGYGSYPVLAGLRLASLNAAEGKTDEALKSYEAVAKTAADANLRGYAQIQAAQLALDKADFTTMQNRLNDLAKPESIWRLSARQLLGLSAYKAGKLTEADDYFAQILSDKDGRGAIAQMAEMMRQLILTATAKPSGAASPPATKTN